MSNYIFFLGGHDAEMLAIRDLLDVHHLPYHDHELAWGASLSAYQSQLDQLEPDAIPVFIELNPDCPYPTHAIIIDHHGHKAGLDRPTSLEQVGDLVGVGLNRRQQLISLSDKGHIRDMRAFGATVFRLSFATQPYTKDR